MNQELDRFPGRVRADGPRELQGPLVLALELGTGQVEVHQVVVKSARVVEILLLVGLDQVQAEVGALFQAEPLHRPGRLADHVLHVALDDRARLHGRPEHPLVEQLPLAVGGPQRLQVGGGEGVDLGHLGLVLHQLDGVPLERSGVPRERLLVALAQPVGGAPAGQGHALFAQRLQAAGQLGILQALGAARPVEEVHRRQRLGLGPHAVLGQHVRGGRLELDLVAARVVGQAPGDRAVGVQHRGRAALAVPLHLQLPALPGQALQGRSGRLHRLRARQSRSIPEVGQVAKLPALSGELHRQGAGELGTALENLLEGSLRMQLPALFLNPPQHLQDAILLHPGEHLAERPRHRTPAHHLGRLKRGPEQLAGRGHRGLGQLHRVGGRGTANRTGNRRTAGRERALQGGDDHGPYSATPIAPRGYPFVNRAIPRPSTSGSR
ncbi:hypothetical protein DYH09_07725 [bacterium CPR1]|nr:hypothetical protein [bacterium CPR1]